MHRRNDYTTQEGFSMLEPLLATTVLAMVSGILLSSLFTAQENLVLEGQRTRANLLAEKGIAAIQEMKYRRTLPSRSGEYGLMWDSSTYEWRIVDSPLTIDGYTHKIIITAVDSNVKNYTSLVEWQQNLQRTGSSKLEIRIAF